MNFSILGGLVFSAFEIDQHNFVRHREFFEHDERPYCPGLRCEIKLHRACLFRMFSTRLVQMTYTAASNLAASECLFHPVGIANRAVWRATIRFSSVGTTRTRQRLSAALIVSWPESLRRASIVIPRCSSPSQ